LLGRLRRSSSQRAKNTPVQTRIGTGPWSTKRKHAKTAIGKAWAKFFHTEAIPSVKVDNPYFVVMVKETQRWGKQIILSFVVFCSHFCLRHCASHLNFFSGEGISIPTDREIDGPYLDSNEEDIKKQF
jgi:hypothetical protein